MIGFVDELSCWIELNSVFCLDRRTENEITMMIVEVDVNDDDHQVDRGKFTEEIFDGFMFDWI